MEIKKQNISLSLVQFFIIAFGIILIIGIGLSYHKDQMNKKNKQIENEIKFRNALTDEIREYKNKEDNWVSEKLTLQTSLDNLSKSYNNLNTLQKDLLIRLKNVEKGQITIAAGLVDLVATIDELEHTGETEVNEEENTIQFTSINEYLEYDFKIGNVVKSNTEFIPTLQIKQLRIPNKQEVHFYWEDNKKDGYPVSFKIVNTNPYISVVGMESYVIPSIDKNELSPNNWERFVSWNKRNKNVIVGGTLGTLVGLGIAVLIVN